jgi:hypothetical protein
MPAILAFRFLSFFQRYAIFAIFAIFRDTLTPRRRYATPLPDTPADTLLRQATPMFSCLRCRFCYY